MNLEPDILARIRPTAEDTAWMDGVTDRLRRAAQAALEAQEVHGVASIQGSIAKDTWLRGARDVDLFLLLDETTPEDRFEPVAAAVGSAVLEAPRRKYAQHPYVVGHFEDVEVDLVPAYKVASPEGRRSAVDRTPFHTAWVREHLDTEGRDQVRLAKQWLRGIGAYGAETAIGGFSGYLVEVMIAWTGGFRPFLSWLADPGRTMRITFGTDRVEASGPEPLVVVDPVDPERNCAAAVRSEVLDTAAEAARAYLDTPSQRFFFPAPPRAEPAGTLHDALTRQHADWIGIRLEPATDRLDLVLPQFQRAARTAAKALEEAGFPVHRLDVQADGDAGPVWIQWVVADTELPATRLHHGPDADAVPNADRFRAKWDGHKDAVGPVMVQDGRMVVPVQVRERTASAWFRAHHGQALVGKHVQKALQRGAQIWTDPADVPEPWAPRVADVVLDRRSWER